MCTPRARIPHGVMSMGAITLLLAAGLAAAAELEPVQNDTAADKQNRRMLGSVSLTSSAWRLAEALTDASSFEVLGGSDKPKYTGSAEASGFVRFSRRDRHELASEFPGGAVVLTTGQAERAVSLEYDPRDHSEPTYPDITNSHIEDSHDAVVVDFWVKAKKSGKIAVKGIFAITDGHRHTRRHPQLDSYDDRFMFEVEGKDLAYLPGESHVSVQSLLDSDDIHISQNMEYYAWDYVSIRKRKVKENDKLRIKIRIADVGDRRVDSAIYLANDSLKVV